MRWNSFFFPRAEPVSFDLRYLEEGRGELGEYREKLELVALTNILQLQENCGLRGKIQRLLEILS